MFKAELAKKVISLSLATAMLVVSPTVIARATTGSYNASSQSGGSGSGSGGGEVVTPGGSGSNETVSTSSASKGSGSSASSASTGTVTVKESSSVVNSEGVRMVTSTVGAYSAASVKGVAVVTPMKDVNAALGLSGKSFGYVIARDSLRGPLAMAQVEKFVSASGVEMGSVLDILLGKTANGEPVSFLDKVEGNVRFVVGIPDNFAGNYDYAMVRMESGGALTVLPDIDNDPTILTFESNASGLFAMVRGAAGCFDAYK